MTDLPPLSESRFSDLIRDCRESSRQSVGARHLHRVDPPEIIYHYTRAEGLLGMVCERALHTTHISFLNDPSEGILGQKLVDEEFLKVVLDEACRDESERDLIRSVLEALAPRTFQSTRNTYVSCFSERGDLIDQWRAYGSNGYGYSIGFDTAQLLQALENRPRIVRVEYESKDPARTWLEQALPYLRGFLTERRLGDWAGFKEDLLRTLLPTTVDVAISNKHGCYRNEEEIRLAFADPTDSSGPGLMRFRCSGNYIVPFLPLPLKRLPIREIIVGPCLDYDYARNGLETLLRSLQLKKIPIRRSELPYRSN